MVVRPTANDDQAGDRRPVVPEISRRRVVGRVEQHGRDEERQRELGQHGERRRAGNKREERAAERQKHRIGRADAARHRCQQRGGEDQANEDFEFSHVLNLASRECRGAARRWSCRCVRMRNYFFEWSL